VLESKRFLATLEMTTSVGFLNLTLSRQIFASLILFLYWKR